MAKNRKAAEKKVYELMDRFDPSGKNTAIYRRMFEQMDDTDFDQFMEGLRDEGCLRAVNPNGSGVQISTKNNLKMAEELGLQLRQRVWIPPKGNVRGYLTPNRYFVLGLFVRRQSQVLQKKMSTAEDNHAVDNLTGQVTSDSRASGLSYPEVSVLDGMGLENCLKEFMKMRGGDEGGARALNTMISRTGQANMDSLEPYCTGVKATTTLSHLLNAAHLSNTLK